MEDSQTKSALKVFIETPNSKNSNYYYEFQHGRSFQKYEGLLGKLGLEKVNRPSAFFYGHHLIKADSFNELAEKIIDFYLDKDPFNGISSPFDELHIYHLTPSGESASTIGIMKIENKIKELSPEIKIGGFFRKFAFNLEETYQISKNLAPSIVRSG